MTARLRFAVVVAPGTRTLTPCYSAEVTSSTMPSANRSSSGRLERFVNDSAASNGAEPLWTGLRVSASVGGATVVAGDSRLG